MKLDSLLLHTVLIVVAWGALAGGPSQAAVVYREIFPTNGWSGVGSDISHTGWDLRVGSTGAPINPAPEFNMLNQCFCNLLTCKGDFLSDC